MAAGEVLTHGEWLVQRSAGAPEALRTRALRWLAEVPPDAPLDLALARAGESALAGALARGEGRETALDLLAADALITLALLARAEREPESLGPFAQGLVVSAAPAAAPAPAAPAPAGPAAARP
jgi:hypothetical protein